MLSPDQQWNALRAPCGPLGFLVRPERRAKRTTGLESLSDSACFHRLYDLCWTLRDPEALALLTAEERAAVEEFENIFQSLPWQPVASLPHMSELQDDDLSPLIPVGERLLRLLEAHAKPQARPKWWHRLVKRFSAVDV